MGCSGDTAVARRNCCYSYSRRNHYDIQHGYMTLPIAVLFGLVIAIEIVAAWH